MRDGVERPIVGATISVLDTDIRAVSDAQGRFTLDNLPDEGHVVLDIDAATATPEPGGIPYACFREALPYIGHVDNLEERPFTLPRLDTASLVQVNPQQTTTVRSPSLDTTLTVPPQTAMWEDGSQFTGQLSISLVPRELTPAALPDFLDPGLLSLPGLHRRRASSRHLSGV